MQLGPFFKGAVIRLNSLWIGWSCHVSWGEGHRIPYRTVEKRSHMWWGCLVHSVSHWCVLAEKSSLAITFRTFNKFKTSAIFANLHSFSDLFKVTVELHKSLSRLVRFLLHQKRWACLNVICCNEQGTFCIARYLNYEEAIGWFDEMTSFVQYNSV